MTLRARLYTDAPDGRRRMVTVIEDDEPATWEELEVRVTRILIESALRAERGASLQTVRGQVDVDVYAVDVAVSPPALTLFECKHWKRAVPQTVVHAFRTV